MSANEKRVRMGCYITNVTMSIVAHLSPILFIPFRNLYGFSYSLLGALVLINFVTQFCVDWIFSFFSHKFNITLAVKSTPVIASVGFVLYALAPVLFPSVPYLGIALGTLVFSAASGLNEVLISPVIAALPADNPEREMSKLHSTYAWGVVAFVVFATLFLFLVGEENWQFLVVAVLVVPVVAALVFARAELPEMEKPERASNILPLLKSKGLWVCVFAMFVGGATEVTMAQWSSSYLERALGLDKVIGDVLGVALFATSLGLGRTLYASRGKNVEKVLLLGGIGAACCYAIAVFTNVSWLGLAACALTGFCVSMLWPGTLVVASSRVSGSVFVFAMMAAGGDLGASVAPQLVGAITDVVSASALPAWASELGLTSETLGMKCGLAVGLLCALLSVAVYAYVYKTRKKEKGMKTIYQRRTIRSYTGEPVSQGELAELLKSAYAAPVGRARYDTLHLCVITQKEFLADLDRATAEANGNPSSHPLYGAPTMILISSQINEPPQDNVNYSNAAIIAQNMALTAVELGVGACHIWGAIRVLNKRADLLERLSLPEGMIPCCALIVGKTAETYQERQIQNERIATSYLK
ncbi:MAG: MFS transporter [Clostridia bacterium]|nr:MFS transporter [Clostridia bacterium]